MKRPTSVLLLCGLYLLFALIILNMQPYLGVWLSNRYGIVIFPYSVLHIIFAVVLGVLAYGLFVGNVWARRVAIGFSVGLCVWVLIDGQNLLLLTVPVVSFIVLSRPSVKRFFS